MEGRCIDSTRTRDFCEVAIWDAGGSPPCAEGCARTEQLEEFASQVGPADLVCAGDPQRPGDRAASSHTSPGSDRGHRGRLPGGPGSWTVQGVGLITAVAFLAQVGEIARFQDPRRLVATFGLDPRVRQSGGKRGDERADLQGDSAFVRHVLVEAATAIRSPDRCRPSSTRPWPPRPCGRDRSRRAHDVRAVLAAAHPRRDHAYAMRSSPPRSCARSS